MTSFIVVCSRGMSSLTMSSVVAKTSRSNFSWLSALSSDVR
jgi:hypothetical protein